MSECRHCSLTFSQKPFDAMLPTFCPTESPEIGIKACENHSTQKKINLLVDTIQRHTNVNLRTLYKPASFLTKSLSDIPKFRRAAQSTECIEDWLHFLHHMIHHQKNICWMSVNDSVIPKEFRNQKLDLVILHGVFKFQQVVARQRFEELIHICYNQLIPLRLELLIPPVQKSMGRIRSSIAKNSNFELSLGSQSKLKEIIGVSVESYFTT